MDTVLFQFVIGVSVQVFIISVLNTNTVLATGRQIKTTDSLCPGTEYFRCDNGECVRKLYLCDGFVDCRDRSDESATVCQALSKNKCAQGWWRCSYGACIRGIQRCDTFKDCWDGTDEILCPQGSSIRERSALAIQPSYKGLACDLPEDANNRQFYTWNGELKWNAPGSFISQNDLLIVSCDPGYAFEPQVGRQFVSNCTNGKWFYDIPYCYKLCPELERTGAILKCYNGPRGCRGPMVVGTEVEVRCKDHRQSELRGNQSHTITCNEAGQWSGPVPRCKPVCGKSNLNFHILPNVSGGQKSELGNFPWHSGIYHKKGYNWELACGGTLITSRLVLTAATCVVNLSRVDVPALPFQHMRVVLGKSYRNWLTSESTEQRFPVIDLIIHPAYRGVERNFDSDIALVLLNRVAEVTTYVMPACIDYTNHNPMNTRADRWTSGYIAGWETTEDCSSGSDMCESYSDTLLYTQLSVIPGAECQRLTLPSGPSPVSLLTYDKYCAGNRTADNVIQGDTGSGQTVVYDGHHYVLGISTLTIELPDHKYAGLTNVSYHMQWIRQEVERLSHISS